MSNETARTKLHIVPQSRRTVLSPEDFIEPGAQGMLFPTPRKGLMIFMYFPDITEQEFTETLRHAAPSYVIELRTSPRFDIGNMNRHLAFQAFQYQNIKYLDLTSLLMGSGNSELLVLRLREFLQTRPPKLDMPIVFLVNRVESDEGLVARVLETFSTFTIGPKYTIQVPSFERSNISGYQLASR